MVGSAQNGWTAGPAAALGGLDNRVVTGTAGVRLAPGVRRGDVAVVAFHFAERFHREVEALVPGWCWGYAYRSVRDGEDLSNHAAGCAWDLNAPRHPLGARGTFTGTQRVALRAILADLDGLVRWGGDYRGRADEMHFEVVGTPAEVAALARRLAGTPVLGRPAPTLPTPTPPAPPAPTPEVPDMDATERAALLQLAKDVPALAEKVTALEGVVVREAEDLLVVQIGTDAGLWVVDVAGHTKWRLTNPDQLLYTERLLGRSRFRRIDGPQAPQLWADYRDVTR